MHRSGKHFLETYRAELPMAQVDGNRESGYSLYEKGLKRRTVWREDGSLDKSFKGGIYGERDWSDHTIQKIWIEKGILKYEW